VVYFQNIYSVSRSICIGMWITLTYFFRPHTIVTVQYPHTNDEIPERHRGLHILETDICIMCYQCEQACPVDCIKIEGVRKAELEGAFQGKGAAISRFTVDYGLCLFCNLCIEPCPVDCIHLGPEYDLSSFSRKGVVRNLLTGGVYTDADRSFTAEALVKIKDIEDEQARVKAEKAAAKKKEKEAKAAAAAEKEAKATQEEKAEKAEKATKEEKADENQEEQAAEKPKKKASTRTKRPASTRTKRPASTRTKKPATKRTKKPVTKRTKKPVTKRTKKDEKE